MNIHEVVQRTGLTKKAIRYYEANGLIKPSINPENQYREYDADDIRRLRLVAALRLVGFSISDIKAVIDDKTKTITALRQQLLRTAANIAQQSAVRDALARCLRSLEQPAAGGVKNGLEAAVDALLDVQSSLEANAQKRVDFMQQELRRLFPGPFGEMMVLAYGPFLNEPVDTPEKKQAWLALVHALDQAEEFTYPESLLRALEMSPPDLRTLEKEFAAKWDRLAALTEADVEKVRERLNSSPVPEPDAVDRAALEFFQIPQVQALTRGIVMQLMILSPRFAGIMENMLRIGSDL